MKPVRRARFGWGDSYGRRTPLSGCTYLTPIRRGNSTPILVIGLPAPLLALCESLPDSTDLWLLKQDVFFAATHRIPSIPQIAENYLKEVVGQWRPCSLVLIGYSFPGAVTLELAKLLRERGFDCQALLLEPAVPGTIPRHLKPTVRASAVSKKQSYAPGRILNFLSWRLRDANAWVDRWKRKIGEHVISYLEKRDMPIPKVFRNQLYYRSRLYRHARNFEVTKPYEFSVTLAGGQDWFAQFGPAWRALIRPEQLRKLDLGKETDHHELLIPESARTWIALVTDWISQPRH